MTAEHLKAFHPPYAGPIDPGFLFADGRTLRGIQQAQRAGLERSERHRLVEAAKSPTREKANEIARNVWECMNHARSSRVESKPIPAPLPHVAEGPLSAIRDRDAAQLLVDRFREQPTQATGTKTIIQYREWSAEWRIRTQVDTTVGSPPPVQAGVRESFLLSDAGARKIADACAFMAATRGGFKTFVTGTFDGAARERIASGETTVQRETTRAMDALTKMYQRGWLRENGTEVEGHADALAYCWVVEVPKNADGSDNPHVHLLLDWQVPYADFAEWSQRIEKIWGNGYFHLEKILDAECAGAYMAKAAGYLTKAAGQSDQGRVTGNRYAISKNARAPAWATLGTYQLGIMGTLIREVYDRIQHKAGDLFKARHALRAERDAVRLAAKATSDDHRKKNISARLQRIGAALIATRQKINAMPVRASKYQLVIKNEDYFERFLAWASEHGWQWNARPDSHGHARMKSRIFQYKKRRMAWNDTALAHWLTEARERIEGAFAAFTEYESLMEFTA